MSKSSRIKVKKAVVVTLLGLLGAMLLLLIGIGVYALSLYSKMTYREKEQIEIDQAKTNAASALTSGIALDTLLMDEAQYRFTLDDVEELKSYYMEWLESQTGVEDSDTSNTLDVWKDPPRDEPLSPEAEKLYNILFLGTDERVEGEKSRADAIMMVTINTEKKTITLTSILRDTYLKLAGTNTYDKICSAYYWGKEDGVQDTLYDYLGLEFDNYAQVNFSSFKKIIDTIGGIDLELSDDEVKRLVQHTKLDGGDIFDPEKQLIQGTERTYHLNGTYALRYCRNRYSNDAGQGDGDFGRTERQRKVIIKIIEKAQAMSLGELMDFIPIILPMMTTDLSIADCTNLLASVGTSYTSYKVQTYRVPADHTWSYETQNGLSVLGVDFVENRRLLHELLFSD